MVVGAVVALPPLDPESSIMAVSTRKTSDVIGGDVEFDLCAPLTPTLSRRPELFAGDGASRLRATNT